MSARTVVAWCFGVVFALLYAYLVTAAFGNLFGLQEMAGLMGLRLTVVGWFWLVLGVALPIIIFAIALLVGRRRTAGARLLLLATGLAAIAMFQLEITLLVPQSGFFAV